MQVLIFVLDASGNQLGDGPITTATGWKSTRVLDSAGTFSFSMPASDPRSNVLAEKRVVECWSLEQTGAVMHGAGIIETITTEPSSDGPTMLTVSGDDLLRELVYRTVGDLDLFDESPDSPTSVDMSYADGSPSVPVTLPASIDLEPGANNAANFLNIGYSEPFGRVDFTLSTGNTVPAAITLQYYNGSDQVSPSGITNTTIVDGKPFAQSGSISFDIPGDWVAGSGGYSIRFYCYPENLAAFTLTAISIISIVPTPDALQRIMALAPPGWSLDAAGAFATESDVYMRFQGESVLSALALLTEQTGEHFRLAVSGRRVEWIGSAQPSSGLRAIAASEISRGTMLIASLRKTQDTYAMWNRLYVYGGGSGEARLTLADTTRSAPAGHALTASYLENQNAQAAFGRIDHQETFGDISPADVSASARQAAADALFDRAYVLLRQHSQPQTAYDLTVIPSTERIQVGQTVTVIYHEWEDSYHAVNIDADLVVLEVVEQIDTDGIRTAALMVATVDYFPINDYRAVATALGDIQTDRSVKLPQSGFSSSGRGVPVSLNVENGLVTSLTREIPIEDGVYPRIGIGIDQLTFRNGQIIAVNGVGS